MSAKIGPLFTYRVQVGLWTLNVKATNEEDAIRQARRQLGNELPRLYDVIRSLTTTRFQVERAA